MMDSVLQMPDGAIRLSWPASSERDVPAPLGEIEQSAGVHGGATGWAPVCTNFVPDLAMQFFHAAVRKRDAIDAGTRWDTLFPICELICAKSHIRVAHTGLDIPGRPVGPPRRPLRMLGEQDRAKLKTILDEVSAKTE
jgi:dihydrodipicolinate synthase/N-acetylneuraminate lyase